MQILQTLSLDMPVLWGVNILIHVTAISSLALVIARRFTNHSILRWWVLGSALALILISPATALITQSVGIGMFEVKDRTAVSSTEPRLASVTDASESDFTKMETAADIDRSTDDFPDEMEPDPTELAAIISSSVGSNFGEDDAHKGGVGKWPVSVLRVFLAVWLVGSVWKLVRMCRGWRQLSLILHHAKPVQQPRIVDALDSACRQLNITKTPLLLHSDDVTSPVAAGLFRPAIVLPSSMTDTVDSIQLQDILLHESAHVARGDQVIVVAQNLCSCLFWSHPFVRMVNQQFAQAREEVCDNYVLQTSSAPSYSKTLLSLAEHVSGEMLPASVGMLGGWRLESRIAGLLNGGRNRTTRLSRRSIGLVIGVSALLMVVGSVATITVVANDSDKSVDPPNAVVRLPDPAVPTSRAATPQAEEPVEPVDWEKGQVVHVTVVHAKTNDPIPGVRLATQFVGKGIDFSTFEAKETDADGKVTLSLPDLPTKSMRIYPAKKGLVPLRCYWEGEPVMENPKTVTLRMSDGNRIGGFVRDEGGAPIANVEVRMEYWGPGEGTNPHLRANIIWYSDFYKRLMPRTDKTGKWQFDLMPNEIDIDRLYIYLKHPDFVSDHQTSTFSPTPLAEKPSWKALRSMTSEMVMRRGESVRGKVVDKDGKPIPNARIFQNQRTWDLPSKDPIATCDENGVFRVGGLKPIEPPAQNDASRDRPSEAKGWSLTFEANGYAPNFINVTNSDQVHTVTLLSGIGLRGQVIDEDGKPVEKVYVSAESWRGERRKFRRVVTTDVDGQFELADLPEDEIEYYVHKQGYMMIENHVMSPEKDFYKITLEKPLTVTGKVVDAETGEPINKFTLVEGSDYGDGRAPYWSAHKKKLIRNGKYEATFDQKTYVPCIRVEAEGYLPAESPNLDPEDASKRNVTLDFKLKRAKPIKGIVWGLDDKPLTGAKVYMARQRMNLRDRKVTSVEQWDRQFVTTDEKGQFAFPPEIEPFCLVVVHEDGLGMVTEMDFAESSTITIKPWNAKNDHQQIVRRPTKGQYVSFPE